MKLKPQCVVVKGSKRCQLARMPGSAVCWFHMNNDVLFPRDREPVEERLIDLTRFAELLREKQGNVCCICGTRFYGNQDVEVDHLNPWSAGCRNDIKGLGLAHVNCNRANSGLLLHDPRIRERTTKIGKHFADGESTGRRLTPAEEQEACRRYEAGENQEELGKAFGVAAPTIGVLLRRHEVEMRSIKEIKGGLTDEQEQEVCQRYAARENTVELGEAFGVSPNCISSILRRHGVKVKSLSEARRMDADLEDEICRRHLAGEDNLDIAKSIGRSLRTIQLTLDRKKIKARTFQRIASFGIRAQKRQARRASMPTSQAGLELQRNSGDHRSSVGNYPRHSG